jgi:hypothetical protein
VSVTRKAEPLVAERLQINEMIVSRLTKDDIMVFVCNTLQPIVYDCRPYPGLL